MATIYKYVSSSSGGGGGGGGGSVSKYSQSFNNTTDWGSAVSGYYSISIMESAHGKGTNPSIEVLESVGADYEIANLFVKFDTSGNITIRVSEVPDNRFTGKIIIL